MSNNKQNRQNRQLLDTSRQRTGGMYEDFINSTRQQYGKDQGDANNLRDTLFDKFANANNFMPQGLKPNSQGWFDLPSGQGSGQASYSAPDYSAVEGGYQDFANTGGVNRGDFNPALDSYKMFMSTGGIGDAQAEALRRRATSQVPAFYDRYKDTLRRRSNVQGGYSPGFDAQMEELGRESARQGFEASRQVEGDIVDKRQQGQMFGTSGFGNLMSDIVGKEQSGRLAGLGGLTGIANSRASAANANSEANAARNDAMQKFLLNLYGQGGRDVTSGLQSLYSSAPGNVGQTGSLLLSGMGAYGNNELNNLGMRNQIQDRSWYDYLPQMLGVGAGLAGAFGIPGMGGLTTPSAGSWLSRQKPTNYTPVSTGGWPGE